MYAHVDHVKVVCELMQQYQMYAKMAKCVFGVPKVEYLGHFISAEGVSTDPKKWWLYRGGMFLVISNN